MQGVLRNKWNRTLKQHYSFFLPPASTPLPPPRVESPSVLQHDVAGIFSLRQVGCVNTRGKDYAFKGAIMARIRRACQISYFVAYTAFFQPCYKWDPKADFSFHSPHDLVPKDWGIGAGFRLSVNKFAKDKMKSWPPENFFMRQQLLKAEDVWLAPSIKIRCFVGTWYASHATGAQALPFPA